MELAVRNLVQDAATCAASHHPHVKLSWGLTDFGMKNLLSVEGLIAGPGSRLKSRSDGADERMWCVEYNGKQLDEQQTRRRRRHTNSAAGGLAPRSHRIGMLQ